MGWIFEAGTWTRPKYDWQHGKHLLWTRWLHLLVAQWASAWAPGLSSYTNFCTLLHSDTLLYLMIYVQKYQRSAVNCRRSCWDKSVFTGDHEMLSGFCLQRRWAASSSDHSIVSSSGRFVCQISNSKMRPSRLAVGSDHLLGCRERQHGFRWNTEYKWWILRKMTCCCWWYIVSVLVFSLCLSLFG